MAKRNNNTKILLLLSVISITLAVAALAVQLPVVNAGTLNANVVANVIVSNTCYISVPANVFFYGANVYPGTQYFTNVLITDTDNGGNAASNVFIAGTGGTGATIGAWFQNGLTTSANYIGVSNTLYSLSSQTSYTGTALTNALANSLGVIIAPNTLTPSTSNNLYFGLNVPSGLTTGNYIQQMEFDNRCGAVNAIQTIGVNVQVGGVCYISLSPTSVQFGTLQPATNYNTNQVVVDTDSGGNAAALIFLEATSGSGATLGNWIGQNNANDMIAVGNTMWSATNSVSYTGTALTNTLSTTANTIPAPSISTPATSANVYFGLGVPGGTPGDTYVQNVLFENSC